MTKEPVRLLLVDENAAVRRALVLRLTRASDLRIIGDTGNLDTAMALVKEQQPDVVVLESKRRDGAALKFCQQVMKASSPPKIVVLTSFANEDERLSLLHLGIEQYLLKDIRTDELIRVVREQATSHIEFTTQS
jgi:DNA-binding NarL/FixJ family response regulator